jgi:hypothetical protein
MFTKVVAGFLAVAAMGYAGTSLYQNRGAMFSSHMGQCSHACSVDDSSVATTPVAACESTSKCDQSESACCPANSCCSAGSPCCQEKAGIASAQQVSKVTDKAADNEIDPWIW